MPSESTTWERINARVGSATGPVDQALLDAPPALGLNLASAPEPLLRTLFEATQLVVRLHGDDADSITVAVTLPGHDIPAIARAVTSAATPVSGDSDTADADGPSGAPVSRAVQMPYVPPVGVEPTLGPFEGEARRRCLCAPDLLVPAPPCLISLNVGTCSARSDSGRPSPPRLRADL